MKILKVLGNTELRTFSKNRSRLSRIIGIVKDCFSVLAVSSSNNPEKIWNKE
jgi:hypothetical protein